MTKTVNVEVKVPHVRTITEFDKGGKFDHIRFELKNGESRDWDLSKISESNQRYAFVDRVKNKGIDDFAGKSSNYSLVVEKLDAMFERLQHGDWNLGRTSGFSGTADLVAAVAEQSGKSAEYIQTLWDDKDTTDATRKTWKDNAGIQAIMLRKRMERAEERAKTSDPVVITVA